MSDLPAGFALDPPPQGAIPGLPPGFTLDSAPKAAPAPEVPDLSRIDDEKQLLGELDKVPSEQRQAVLDKWATGRVALDRQGFSSASKRVGDAISRISQAVPVLGGLTDEGEAALHRMNGGNYDVQLAYSRARNRAQNEAETPKISTPFGDVYESGAEKALGTIGGAAAMPFARVTSGTGALTGAADAVANAVPYAAADAFARGEGGAGNRAEAALDTVPAAVGESALLGGALGKLQRQFQSTGQRGPSGPTRNQIVGAADQEGVTFPDFLASDSQVKKNIAGAMASQPLTGSIIRSAADDTASQIGNRLNQVSDEFSNTGGTGLTAGTPDATAAAATAGYQVRDSLENWIKKDSANTLKGMYDGVFGQTRDSNLYQISDTRRAIVKLLDESQRNATPIGERIANVLDDALNRPGMSANGIKGLRTYIGNIIDDTVLPGAGTVQPGFKQVYRALTDDLRFALGREGGKRLVGEWEQANATASHFSENRENLTRIIGLDASAPGERIVDRLITMAGTKGGADMNQLLLARGRTQPNVWSELSAAAVRRLGQGNASQAGSPGMTGGFSPDRFMTSWNKLSDNGKTVLFGASGNRTLRDSLDNIALMSDRFRDIRKFQNPSGTAQVVGATTLLGELAAALAGHVTAGATAVTQVAGSGLLSYLLSRPAGAHAVSNWGSAYTNWAAGAGNLPLLKLSTLTLAKHVSDETGQNERDVADRLNALAGAH